MNFNKTIILGNAAADPEVRTTQSGQKVCSLRVATNRTWKDAKGERQQSTEFHSVVLWGRLAEITGQYVKRGGLVLVEGRLQTRSWDDQQGNKRWRTEIVAENMQLGPKGASGQDKPAANPPEADKQAGAEEIPVIEDNEDIDVKDIPF